MSVERMLLLRYCGWSNEIKSVIPDTGQTTTLVKKSHFSQFYTNNLSAERTKSITERGLF